LGKSVRSHFRLRSLKPATCGYFWSSRNWRSTSRYRFSAPFWRFSASCRRWPAWSRACGCPSRSFPLSGSCLGGPWYGFSATLSESLWAQTRPPEAGIAGYGQQSRQENRPLPQRLFHRPPPPLALSLRFHPWDMAAVLSKVYDVSANRSRLAIRPPLKMKFLCRANRRFAPTAGLSRLSLRLPKMARSGDYDMRLRLAPVC